MKALAELPALYRTEILVANPADELAKDILIVFDDVRSSLMSREKSSHHIPQKVFARTARSVKFAGEGAVVTIALGDTVGVLALETASSGERFGLVRTDQGTYGWVADFHVADAEGKRLNTLK